MVRCCSLHGEWAGCSSVALERNGDAKPLQPTVEQHQVKGKRGNMASSVRHSELPNSKSIPFQEFIRSILCTSSLRSPHITSRTLRHRRPRRNRHWPTRSWPSALFASSRSPTKPLRPVTVQTPIVSHALLTTTLPTSHLGICPSPPHDLDMNTPTTRAPTQTPHQTCSPTSSSPRTIQPPSITRSKSVRRRPSR